MLQAAPPCSPSHSRVAWTLRADHASGRARGRSKLRLGWPGRVAPAGAVTARRRHGQGRNYAANELPEKFDQIVQSWDTANKAGELAPTLTLPRMRRREGRGRTSWGIRGKNLYLLHVLRKRMEYPELKRALCEQCEAFAANVVLIEDRASGTQLIQELVADGMHAVTRYQPQSDKIMRMHAQTAMIENGSVHLPKEAAWLAEYVHELTVFPKGKHDDQVDSTAQMLDWFKRGGQEPQDWMWQMYKQAQARGPQPTRPEPLSVMAKRLGILRPL
jgi:predicted phage terminase large subunit-like protein